MLGDIDCGVQCPGVGRVKKNGPGASKYKPGQRVTGVPWPTKDGNGTWQQYVAVPEANLVRANLQSTLQKQRWQSQAYPAKAKR